MFICVHLWFQSFTPLVMKSQILALALCLLIVVGGIWWHRHSQQPAAAVTLVASANWDGQIEPCGCSPNQPGGLSRRATVLAALPLKHALMVDCGNVVASDYDPKFTRFRYLLLGMEKLGYQVVNLGANEVGLGAENVSFLRSSLADQKFNLKFVSANVLNAQTGKPVVEPYRIVNVAGVKAGITGVATGGAGTGLRVGPSGPAVARVVSQLKGQVDLIVALQDRPAKVTFYDRAGQLRWSQAVPETAPGGKVFLAQAPLANLAATKVSTYDVPFKTTPAAEYVKTVNDYKRVVSALEFDPTQWAPYSPFYGSDVKFVGDTSCASCHAQAHAIWVKTGHATAMAVLQKNNDEGRPECVRCHSVGYALPAGFKSLKTTPHLANVQCESCHGPGAAHVAYYHAAHSGPQSSPPAYGQVGEKFCVNCHDPDNDPKYQKLGFAHYWPKIQHGLEPSAKQVAERPNVREMLAALDDKQTRP